MKFIVNRASIWSNARPCWEAVPETISYNSCGKQREENVWVVELGNLNELMKFKEKYGNLVVGDRIFGFGTEKEVHYDTITIYDDYLE